MQINSLLNKLLEPFTSVEYYKKVVNKSFSTSILTLATVLISMAFVSGLQFVFTQLPNIENSIQRITEDLTNHYPEDLVFEWNGHELTANRDSISVPWPEDSAFHIEGLPTQFLFYTNSHQTPEDLNISSKDYLVFVNSNEIYHMNNEKPEEWTSQTLATFIGSESPATIDKSTVTQLTEAILNFINTRQIQIQTTVLILYSLFFLSGKLWFLFIETILVILLFKLYATRLTAKQTVLLTLHVMIPTVVLTTVANLLYTNIPFPLQMVTFWILILFLSFQFKQKEKEEK